MDVPRLEHSDYVVYTPSTPKLLNSARRPSEFESASAAPKQLNLKSLAMQADSNSEESRRRRNRNFGVDGVYVDESGDHSLESINPRYPLFVLAFCIFQKDHYAQKVIPSLSRLKMSIFGHELIILHEQEIRKKTGTFHKLSQNTRERLMQALSDLVADMDMILIPIVIYSVHSKVPVSAASAFLRI